MMQMCVVIDVMASVSTQADVADHNVNDDSDKFTKAFFHTQLVV